MHATTLVAHSPADVSAETQTLTTALARTRSAHQEAATDTYALGETSPRSRPVFTPRPTDC